MDGSCRSHSSRESDDTPKDDERGGDNPSEPITRSETANDDGTSEEHKEVATSKARHGQSSLGAEDLDAEQLDDAMNGTEKDSIGIPMIHPNRLKSSTHIHVTPTPQNEPSTNGAQHRSASLAAGSTTVVVIAPTEASTAPSHLPSNRRVQRRSLRRSRLFSFNETDVESNGPSRRRASSQAGPSQPKSKQPNDSAKTKSPFGTASVLTGLPAATFLRTPDHPTWGSTSWRTSPPWANQRDHKY